MYKKLEQIILTLQQDLYALHKLLLLNIARYWSLGFTLGTEIYYRLRNNNWGNFILNGGTIYCLLELKELNFIFLIKNLEVGRRALSRCGPALHNGIRDDIKITHFKAKIKEWLGLSFKLGSLVYFVYLFINVTWAILRKKLKV